MDSGLEIPVADLHQDLLSHAEAVVISGEEPQTGFPLLKRSPIRLVVASTFNMHEGARVISAENAAYSLSLMDQYMERTVASGGAVVLEPNDLKKQVMGPLLVIHVEGIQMLGEDVSAELGSWWHRGCRSIGPMWNLDNGLGGGPEQEETGLSPKGREVVRWIDHAPMMLDLSHMGMKTFWETVNTTDGPVLASHSNVKRLCDHPRNLDDDQIRAIAERGGTVGMVLSKGFLGLGEDIEAVLSHAEYIVGLVGPEYLSIGTDLGGLTDLVEEIPSADRMGVLVSALTERFGQEVSRSICWDNAIRVIGESLQGSPPG